MAKVAVETEGPITIVSIDRFAEARNAVDPETASLLRDAFLAFDRDESQSVAILTGRDGTFCAGFDLKVAAARAGTAIHDPEGPGPMGPTRHLLSKPVIAAVEGYALGGGFILAVSCDLVVTAANVRWHLPEVLNGWTPPWGLGALLARVGPVKARALTWGAEPIDGNEAYRLGVADVVAPAGEALAAAAALAQKLAKLPPEAVKSVKKFYEPFAANDSERLDQTASRLFAQDCESAAAKSTLARFTVKA